jgi:hypothetical protein
VVPAGAILKIPITSPKTAIAPRFELLAMANLAVMKLVNIETRIGWSLAGAALILPNAQAGAKANSRQQSSDRRWRHCSHSVRIDLSTRLEKSGSEGRLRIHSPPLRLGLEQKTRFQLPELVPNAGSVTGRAKMKLTHVQRLRMSIKAVVVIVATPRHARRRQDRIKIQ